MTTRADDSKSGGFIPPSVRAPVANTASTVTSYFHSDNSILVRLTQIVIVYVAWLGIAAVFPENLMPTPQETFSILYELTVVQDVVVENFLITLRRVLIAFVVSFAIALVVGILMGTTDVWEHLLLPYLIIIMIIPGVLWATLILLTMGFGDLTAITIAIIGPAAFSAIQVWKGTENIDRDLLEMASAFEVSRLRVIRRSIIPNIAPELFAVARFGLTLAFKVMLIAELFATSDGMGAQIFQTYSSYQYQEAWAWVLVIGLSIAVLETGLRRLEKRVFAYRQEGGLENAMA